MTLGRRLLNLPPLRSIVLRPQPLPRLRQRLFPKPRLYRTTWTNPQPHHVVTHLDYESLLTACGPFLVAVTVE